MSKPTNTLASTAATNGKQHDMQRGFIRSPVRLSNKKDIVMHTKHQTTFPLGRTVATPGALELLESLSIAPVDLLKRHQQGDWGQLCDEDKEANDQALIDGDRILSAYEIGGEKVWIITEWDRSATTILLPSEY